MDWTPRSGVFLVVSSEIASRWVKCCPPALGCYTAPLGEFDIACATSQEHR